MAQSNSFDTPVLSKTDHLERLSDSSGRFSMLAVDQRQSLRKMIAGATGGSPDEVTSDDLLRVKRVVSEIVAPESSAVLLDPIYGYPDALNGADYDGGVLVSAEKTGYVRVNGHERRSRLVDEWDAEAWVQSGANGVKLLIWHHPAASADTRAHQEEIVQRVGEECERAGLPLLLESKVYALFTRHDAASWARIKPYLVLDAVRTFSAPKFKVDLLKLDFPVDLRYVSDYQKSDVSWHAGESVYDRAAAEAFCKRINEEARTPWVILSAGVELGEFLENIRLANRAGASGFLCGRTVWKDVIEYFPDERRMREHMVSVGRPNFHAIQEVNQEAKPWHEHLLHRDKLRS